MPKLIPTLESLDPMTEDEILHQLDLDSFSAPFIPLGTECAALDEDWEDLDL